MAHAGVSQLYDRLGDMEAAMRELAQAQANSSTVLSELGGRLGPAGAGHQDWPSQAHAGTGTNTGEQVVPAVLCSVDNGVHSWVGACLLFARQYAYMSLSAAACS
jgi:hypothetical protein